MPTLALEVGVEEVFHHCSKAFLRCHACERPDESLEQLDAYYGPSYADSIYG